MAFVRSIRLMYKTHLAIRVSFVEADDKTSLGQMASLFKSLHRLVRVFLQGIEKIIPWLGHARSDYLGHDVTKTGIIPALVWRSKENKKTGRFDDRFICGI